MNSLFEVRKSKFEKFGLLRSNDNSNKKIISSNSNNADAIKTSIAKKLFVECSKCKENTTKNQLRELLYVCPICGFHFQMPPEKRIVSITDMGTFKAFKYRLADFNPLGFEGYLEKKASARERTREDEAVLSGVGKIDGRKAVIVVMNSRFMMGSMGIAVGEIVTNAIEYANKNRLPLIIFTASGGARMQEGILSLMQMAKTSAAMERFRSAGGLYIAYLTHPTTGGVSASFAGLGDITLAEPEALIGFAGPRVIEQTIRQKLPEGFQRSEYLQEHGFVDMIVPRSKMKETLSKLLKLHQY